MATRQRKNSKLSGFIIPAFSALVIAYFIHHAQTGTYGVHVMRAMDIKASELNMELASIKKKRMMLEHRVGQLTDGTIEADALDENARYVLGMAGENEVVVLYD
ncbi:MAG: septum formation initiator family protein [Nitratireductor sp.]